MARDTSIAHQAWIQGLLSHRIVSREQAKMMHKSVVLALRQPYDEDDYDHFFASANRALSRVDLEIRSTRDERSGVEMVLVVNMRGDEHAQLATSFSAHEIALVKLLIEEIFTAPGHAYNLSSTHALDLGHALDPEMPPSRVQGVCNKLVRQGWLRADEGFFSLTPRLLMELQTYLRSNFEPYLHACAVCKDTVTKGFTCATDECDVFVHTFCRTFHESAIEDRRERGTYTCAECNDPWQPVAVGARDRTSAISRQPRGRRTRVQRGREEPAEEEQDSEEQDDDETQETEEDELEISNDI